MATLYINGYEVTARLVGERIELSKRDKQGEVTKRLMAPLFELERAVVIGHPCVSMAALTRLAQEGIPVIFLTSGGRWLGGLYPNRNGHGLRRLRQYELARDPAFALKVARWLAAAKITNSRRVLQRLAANREESQTDEQADATNTLQHLVGDAAQATDLNALRGYEGVASAVYFKRLGGFFPAAVPFRTRSRRPPRDAANSLLSFTYAVVLGEIDTAIRAAGLDPTLGFLHEISYGRPSLSLDLLELFRGPLCDLLVLQILNHGILKPTDFEERAADSGVYLRREARAEFFREYERAVERLFTAKRGEAHTSFRKEFQEQVNCLVHALEGNENVEFFTMP